MQFVLLGTGQAEYHAFFEDLASRFPDQVGVNLGFDDPLAHLMEAGADLFLMPSAFEPCGLNQMYSLRYGTIPIVRRTGGLADSILDATPDALSAGTATGFVFEEYSPTALRGCLNRALDTFETGGKPWQGLVQTAMAEDHSWDQAAAVYEELMERLVAERRGVAVG